MIQETKITLKGALRAEDAAVIAQNASKFASDVYLIKGSKKVNAKSIMGIISLTLHFGDAVFILTSGQDEDVAANRIKELL